MYDIYRKSNVARNNGETSRRPKGRKFSSVIFQTYFRESWCWETVASNIIFQFAVVC